MRKKVEEQDVYLYTFSAVKIKANTLLTQPADIH
jgi:hypothetical protein